MTDWKERAERAEAELARLRALLTRTIDHVSYGSRRSYDGVGGYKMREAASQLLLEIMAALAAIVAPPAQPAEPVQPLQGDPVTLADVLDALNVFNKPRPSEGGEPWTEADFISVKHLPDFINIIAVAWFSRTQPAEPVQPVCSLCQGTGVVDDGEINCYPNGEPYENGPVKCVKDCPRCANKPPAEPVQRMLAFTKDQGEMFDPTEEGIACFCGD